jgi:hypothetical protein
MVERREGSTKQQQARKSGALVYPIRLEETWQG